MLAEWNGFSMQRLVLVLAVVAAVVLLGRLLLARLDNRRAPPAAGSTLPAPVGTTDGTVAKLAFAALFLLVLGTSAGWLEGL